MSARNPHADATEKDALRLSFTLYVLEGGRTLQGEVETLLAHPQPARPEAEQAARILGTLRGEARMRMERFELANDAQCDGAKRALRDLHGDKALVLSLQGLERLQYLAQRAQKYDFAALADLSVDKLHEAIRGLPESNPARRVLQETLARLYAPTTPGAENLAVDEADLEALMALPAWKGLCPLLDTAAVATLARQTPPEGRKSYKALEFGRLDGDDLHVHLVKDGARWSLQIRRYPQTKADVLRELFRQAEAAKLLRRPELPAAMAEKLIALGVLPPDEAQHALLAALEEPPRAETLPPELARTFLRRIALMLVLESAGCIAVDVEKAEALSRVLVHNQAPTSSSAKPHA